MTPLQAAGILVADYAGQLVAVESLSLSGVQATIVVEPVLAESPILVIRGTNEFSDWLRYNFRTMPKIGPGDRFHWHRGFLQHAQIAYAFAKGKGIGMVIGHSLGAAAAGIVAVALDVPALTFATPRALHSANGPENESVVRNFCRIDDLVCMVPPACLGFRHLGMVHWLRTKGRHIGEEHALAHYLELLEDLA